MSMDLTALLDVILIILFAVMLNISQSSNAKDTEQEALTATLTEYQKSQEQLESINQKLTEQLDQSQSALLMAEEAADLLKTEYEQLKAIEIKLNQQQVAIITELIDSSRLSDSEKEKIIEAQRDSELMSSVLEQLTKTPEDSKNMMENIHKYSVIANKFLFLDITIDVDTGEFIFDNQPSGIIINETDGFDSHLFQLKKEALVDYMFDTIKDNDRTYSFILITTKYDPYLTRRYYLTLITDAIDTLRNENDAYIIFDTDYLIN